MSFFDVSPESNISPEDGSYIEGDKTAGFILDAGRGTSSPSLQLPRYRFMFPMRMLIRRIGLADAIPSAALHPYLPLLATCSGARHPPPSPPSSESSSSSDSESDSNEDEDDASEREASASIPLATCFGTATRATTVVGTGGQVRMNGSGFRPKEAMLRLWDFTGRPASTADEVVDAPGAHDAAVAEEAD